MRKIATYLTILITVTLGVVSCTMQKRQYRNGYYFSSPINCKIHNNADNNFSPRPENNFGGLFDTEEELIDGHIEFKYPEGQDTIHLAQQNNPLLEQSTVPINKQGELAACDILVMKSGDELEVKVLEIGTDVIKYRKCGSDEGPIFTIEKRDALMVKYVDGTKTVFNSSTENKDPLLSMASSKNGKSQLVAFLLCFFFGALGIHRFYLGYFEIGIIQLLTVGGCGIWYLIDLIMILTGDLKPKNGEYGSKF